MSVESEQLKKRTFQFALDVMRMVDALPADAASRYLGSQLMRSANGLAANYRAACRARSRREFVSRLAIVTEEADEAAHWFAVLEARGVLNRLDASLLREARELVAIFSKSCATARRNLKALQSAHGPK